MFILLLRNQESVRRECHNTGIIDTATHLNYMKKLENSPNAYQWIVMCDNQNVGYIKIINLEFGSSLKEEFRGKGIGTKAYELVFEEVKKMGLKKLTADVKINRNTPIKFEEKTGWKKIGLSYRDGKPYAYKLEKELD